MIFLSSSSSCILLLIIIDLNITSARLEKDFQQGQYSANGCLICLNGDTIKFSVSSIVNVALNDATAWRSLICTYSLEGAQQLLPKKSEDKAARSRATVTTTINRINKRFIKDQKKIGRDDLFREFIYKILEGVFEKNYVNGRQCLLRLICENAQIRQHTGLLTQLLNVILLPGNQQNDDDYSTAYLLGRSGANCLEVYHLCPRGRSVFDEYLMEF